MKNKKNEKLTAMKDQYEQIPVPEAASERMKAGIEAAKKDKKSGMIFRLVRNTGVTAAAAMLMLGILVNADAGIANAMENIPIIGALAKVVTFRTFEDKSNGFEADIKVPKVTLEEGGSGTEIAANQSIDEYADQLMKQYEDDLAASEGEGHYSLTSNYEVVTDNSKYLCIRVNTTLVMASGAEYVKVFTVDKATGQTVSLDQLFSMDQDYKKKISDNIKQQMTEQMAADEYITYFFGNNDMGDEFNFNQITGNESFYFNANGELVITFDEYTVAPGFMGAVEFIIPKSLTGDLL